MVRSFNSVGAGEDAIASNVQQILDVIMGATGGDVPLVITRLDHSTIATLTLRNRGGGPALVIQAADGTPVMSFPSGTGGGAAPTVAGSRGGNAALASLLTALDALGIINDGTTS